MQSFPSTVTYLPSLNTMSSPRCSSSIRCLQTMHKVWFEYDITSWSTKLQLKNLKVPVTAFFDF